ncbi:MAG TPA: DUF4126 domain-containing protein [Blastocatellia bacterium]|nr:DUF4126 domain-containing protein [Blastocatellia bacterium]
MDFISTIAIAMGASWVSGIKLYAAVAMLGLLGRFANLQLPGELHILTNWWVIGVALALYAIEFVADKIPFIDSTWDVVHTFIRIPAGAVIAAAAFGDFDRGVQVIAFLIGGGLALSSHGTKTTTRAAVNTSPEPFSNIAVSLAEDGLSIGSVLLAAFYPILLFIVVSIGLLISIIVLPKIISYIRGVIKKVQQLIE